MYWMNAAKTLETHTRMKEFQTTLGITEILVDAWQSHSTAWCQTAFFQKMLLLLRSLKLQWLANKRNYLHNQHGQSCSAHCPNNFMGKLVNTFFITRCPGVHTSSVLAGQLFTFFLQRQHTKYHLFDWQEVGTVISSSEQLYPRFVSSTETVFNFFVSKSFPSDWDKGVKSGDYGRCKRAGHPNDLISFFSCLYCRVCALALSCLRITLFSVCRNRILTTYCFGYPI